MERMRFPLDQGRMKMVAKKVWEVRRWETNEDGQRSQSETQSKNKAGVPLWEIVCVSLADGPDQVRVVLASAEKPEFEAGDPVRFTDLDAVVWKGKNGIGADYYARGVESAGDSLTKAAA